MFHSWSNRSWRLLPLLAFLIAFTLLPGGRIAVGTQVPASQSASPALTLDVNLVNVAFSVTDKKGRFVRDQGVEKFKVYEEGRIQTITNFAAETDLPLTVALLIDSSGSAQRRLQFEEDAAIRFYSSALIPGKDRGLVVSFATGIHLLQDYTDDPDLLAKSIRTIHAGGSTVLQDAVSWTITEKLANQKGRRVIVIISDGDDNSSRIPFATVMETAQHYDVVIFAVSTNATRLGGESVRRGESILRAMTELTGGRLFEPEKVAEVSADFGRIAQELRSQYTLAYLPTNTKRDGTFRRIRIEDANKRYDVRARNGYFAPLARLP